MEVKDTEPLFQTLFDNSPDAIFVEDTAGIVLDCNAAAAALHGTTRENIIGKNVLELVPPEIRQKIVTLSTPQREFESFSYTIDGRSIPVSIRTNRIQYLGQPALLLHVRDITEETTVRQRSEEARRRLEEEVQVAQKMEAVGRLAGGVAHDFNNLLTVIIGRAEVLLERLSTTHPMRPELLLIYDSAQKAAAVTRQLLAFGGKQVLQPQVLNINSVIGNVDVMLRSLIGENVMLSLELADELWSVEADRGQLEQVIMNLVVNALDAMPDGGQLRLQTRNVNIERQAEAGFELEEGRYVVFAVQDTGNGMDSETLSHVFEPFFTTKDKSKGTGLGLSTVYGIVKQSGGYISAQSHPNQGTTFRVYLPGISAPAGSPPARPADAAHGTETILVAEDAELIRQLTREILEVRGYRVLEAANGEEALRICKNYEGAIHLTLSDVVMPGMNGRELADQVIRIRPEIKVLLMSGYADQISQAGFLRPGLHFIEKPFTSNSLALKVREVLDQSDN